MSEWRNPWILVPVKGLAEGKVRLSPILSTGKRRSLAEFFLRHAMSIAIQAVGRERTAIVSESVEALGIAREFGVKTILQSDGGGLNGGILVGVTKLRSMHDAPVLIIPTDLPLAQPADLQEIISLGECRGFVICPDKEQTGTNALYLADSVAFSFRFGTNSFTKHLREAKLMGVKTIVHQNVRIAFDIDQPRDLSLWHSRYKLHPPRCPLVQVMSASDRKRGV